MVRVAFALVFFSVAAVLTGCSSSGPAKAKVSGTVTLDKKNLKEGEIVFVTPGRAPEPLPITDGVFSGEVEVGENRIVEILAYKTAPAVPMQGETFEASKVNYLPARYNVESQLRVKVTASGPNEFKYELTSDP
jgi:hypothetical protein